MLVFSSLMMVSYVAISLLFETIMQTWPDYSVYAGFSPLLNVDIWSVSHLTNLFLQALLFNAVFIWIASPKVNWNSGLRFGMTVASLCLVVCLTGLMFQMGDTSVEFITQSLTSLCALQFLRLTVSGLISGWLYQQYLQRTPRLQQLWI